MLFPPKRLIAGALIALAACTTSSPKRIVVTPTTEASRPSFNASAVNDALTFRAAADVQRVKDAAALIKIAETAKAQVRTATGVARPPVAVSASDHGCAYASLIRSVWLQDAEWAIGIAWRESNCQPTARNGSSGSAGLFQLLGHEDMFRYACPGQDPAMSWADPECNVRAAWHLYEGAGRAPWRL